MKTPNKIKNFAWRPCRDILANKVNLKRRTITKDDLCSECGKEPESNCHIFWFCDKVKDIWGNSMLVFPFHMESWWSFMDVVWQIVQCRLCDSSLLETTMTLCWEIWKSRNSVRHGGPCSSGKSVFQRALALMQEYRAATEIVHSPRPTEAVKWHPPNHPLYKLNMDAAVIKELNATGIGMVVCDWEGNVLAAMSKRISAPLATLEAEAKSMEVAIQFT